MSTPSTRGEPCFDTLPVAALLFDEALRIRQMNRVACETFRVVEDEAVGRLPGEVIRCATASHRTCGTGTVCGACHLWQALEAAVAGETDVHREVALPILGEHGAVRQVLLCSTAPAAANGGGAVVILHDITNLQRLPGMIAICAQCKQVRQGDEWLPLDSYIETRSHALFTHTLCPRCEVAYYRELGEEPSPAGEGETL